MVAVDLMEVRSSTLARNGLFQHQLAMRSGDNRTFRFEGFGLDLRRGCLLGPDGEAELRRKSFEVLCYLVANAGRLARKDEIIRAVWQSVAVSDASLAQCISEIRLVLRDSDQRVIRTVARRGYLFAAPVSDSAEPHTPQPALSNPITAPTVESPAVGPFDTVAARGPAAARHATDRLVAPPQPAERRRLTILACEWIGLAALAAQLDPEDLRVRVAACLRRCTDIARRHQGSVARLLDDGLLIYFGYPMASEHDAEHAVRAGLELLAEPAFSAVTGQPRDETAGAEAPFAQRIGVASGLVVIDHEITGEPRQPAAVGAAPHIAKRLLTSAPIGSLVIDHNTRRLVGGWFEYRAAEPVVLDDRAEPIRAWCVTAPSRIESRFEALRDGARLTMVGREEETDLLLRRWQRAQGGDGQVVLICGEAGIGKSWLTTAMLDRMAAEPRAQLRCYCSPRHADSALHPILRQLEAAAGVAAADEAPTRLAKLEALLARTEGPPEERAALADLFAAARPGRPPALDLPPQQRRRQILDAITRRFEAEARRQPLVAVFEDLQWIDPTSLDALARIIDRVARLPALLIATFRPEFAPPWVGAPHVTLLTLGRLCRRDCRDLVDRTAADRPIRSELANEIVARSDGVPLFVEELTRSALEADACAPAAMASAGAEESAATRPPDVPMPASLHASLAARLDRLGSARELAQIGAVIGRRFSYETLAAVTGRSATELTQQLDRLVETGLVLREGQPPDASFLFRHALIQDAAYDTLSREARRALHGQIATALGGRFPADGSPDDTI